MTKIYQKQDYPLDEIRRHLEPGPIVLVSSHWRGKDDIMTMGWHMMMEFTPALIGCLISGVNHSFELIRKSKECVINVPTVDLAETVVGIGNSHGTRLDKFKRFGLTRVAAETVKAPLIGECYASFECRVADSGLISKYNFFIFEAVKAHVAASPKNPKTIHYRGEGEFMVAGRTIDLSDRFKRQNL